MTGRRVNVAPEASRVDLALPCLLITHHTHRRVEFSRRVDYETFRIPPLTSERTIRIPREGG